MRTMRSRHRIENAVLVGFRERHTLWIIIRAAGRPAKSLTLLPLAIAETDDDRDFWLAGTDGRSIGGSQRPATIERTARGAVTLPTRESAQYAAGRTACSRRVLHVGNVDSPGAAANRNAGNRRGIARFQSALRRCRGERADEGQDEQALTLAACIE